MPRESKDQKEVVGRVMHRLQDGLFHLHGPSPGAAGSVSHCTDPTPSVLARPGVAGSIAPSPNPPEAAMPLPDPTWTFAGLPVRDFHPDGLVDDPAVSAYALRGGDGPDAVKQLRLEPNVLRADYGQLPDLAKVDWGTATAPIYLAHERGIKVHVWVDETRPRNQGASLTAWELGHHGVPHTVIPDNTGGHLMQHGKVDLAIVGTDRVAANGDVCNKIGTYLKALAAHDNGVPFYVALPSPTIDFSINDGSEIPIEQRAASEVTHMSGRTADGRIENVRIVPEGSPIANYGFDVTPARLVTGLITERGVLRPDHAALASAFPGRTGTR